MKLWDIVKSVGADVIREVVPGGSLILSTVNALLPEDYRLGDDATGEDIASAIGDLSPADQAAIMEKDFDVEIVKVQEGNASVRAMLDADTKNPHTTRPYIAKQAFHVIAFSVVMMVGGWGYGIAGDDEKMVAAIVDGWPFVLAVLAPLITLLQAYFGVLRTEHKNRLDAAGGESKPSGIAAIIAAFRG